MYIYQATLFQFLSFSSSIVGLGLGLVVGLGTVLVLFCYCIFFFPMYVKRPKITTRSTVPCWCSGVVLLSCLLSQELTGLNPAVRVIIFFTFFFQLLFTSFLLIRVRVSFSVHFAVTVSFNNCD